ELGQGGDGRRQAGPGDGPRGQVEIQVATGADLGLASWLVAAHHEGQFYRGGALRGDRAGDEIEIVDADGAAGGLVDIAQFRTEDLDAADIDRGRADAAASRARVVRRGRVACRRRLAPAEQVVDAEAAVR